MSKTTELINKINAEMAKSAMTNEEFAKISSIMINLQVEIRSLEAKLLDNNNVSVTAGPTFSASFTT